jgi:Sulfotransferase family
VCSCSFTCCSYANIFKKASKLIKKRHRKRGTPWEEPVTFREFVAFLLDKRTKRPFDRHWQPMHELCDPCRVRYDFIGHYETLKTDIVSIRSHLDIPESIPFPKIVGGIKKPSRRNSSALIIQAMSQLTARQRVRLRQLYKLDFELFGYR